MPLYVLAEARQLRNASFDLILRIRKRQESPVVWGIATYRVAWFLEKLEALQVPSIGSKPIQGVHEVVLERRVLPIVIVPCLVHLL